MPAQTSKMTCSSPKQESNGHHSVIKRAVIAANGRGLNKGEILAKPYSCIRLGHHPDPVQLITRVDLCPLDFRVLSKVWQLNLISKYYSPNGKFL